MVDSAGSRARRDARTTRSLTPRRETFPNTRPRESLRNELADLLPPPWLGHWFEPSSQPLKLLQIGEYRFVSGGELRRYHFERRPRRLVYMSFGRWAFMPVASNCSRCPSIVAKRLTSACC